MLTTTMTSVMACIYAIVLVVSLSVLVGSVVELVDYIIKRIKNKRK